MRLKSISMAFLLAAVCAAFFVSGTVVMASGECEDWLVVGPEGQFCDGNYRPPPEEPRAPEPAPLPEPGGKGDLHVVRAWVRKEVQRGADGRYQSVIVTATETGTKYKTMMAYERLRSKEPDKDNPEQACRAGEPLLIGGRGGRDLPQYGSFLAEEIGEYVQLDRLDLERVPNASRAIGSWNYQPNWGELAHASGFSVPKELERAPVPGILYINLVLVTDPGDTKWRIESWQWIFEVSGSLGDIDKFIEMCTNLPPPCPEGDVCEPPDPDEPKPDWVWPAPPSPMPGGCVPKDGWEWITECKPPRRAIVR